MTGSHRTMIGKQRGESKRPPRYDTAPTMRILNDWLSALWRVALWPSPGSMRALAERSSRKARTAGAGLAIAAAAAQTGFLLRSGGAEVPRFAAVILFGPLVAFFWVFAVHLLHQNWFRPKGECLEKLLFVLSAILIDAGMLAGVLGAIPAVPAPIAAAAPLLFAIPALVAIFAISKLRAWQAAAVAGTAAAAAAFVVGILWGVLYMVLRTAPTPLGTPPPGP